MGNQFQSNEACETDEPSLKKAMADKDYQLSEDLEDETTIEEQERLEGEVDHEVEVKNLMEEGSFEGSEKAMKRLFFLLRDFFLSRVTTYQVGLSFQNSYRRFNSA